MAIRDSALYALTPDFYVKLYSPWHKGGHLLPHFQGVYAQRGQGFLSDFFRYAVPILRHIGKAALPHALAATQGIISDIKQGRKLRPTLKEHGLRAARRTAVSALTGRGRKRKRRRKAISKLKRVEKKKRRVTKRKKRQL
ncbi:MAG: hypothetical protein GY858_05430 [Candidatus Omnitrophica bacterium]|nr:hypothetical protein [Candidatus Omnitrophota bacterium]